MKFQAPTIVAIVAFIWFFIKATKFFIRLAFFILILAAAYFLIKQYQPDVFTNASSFMNNLLSPEFKDALT
jgi:hypothetical protein